MFAATIDSTGHMGGMALMTTERSVDQTIHEAARDHCVVSFNENQY
jgi:hypothetical protein